MYLAHLLRVIGSNSFQYYFKFVFTDTCNFFQKYKSEFHKFIFIGKLSALRMSDMYGSAG